LKFGIWILFVIWYLGFGILFYDTLLPRLTPRVSPQGERSYKSPPLREDLGGCFGRKVEKGEKEDGGYWLKGIGYKVFSYINSKSC